MNISIIDGNSIGYAAHYGTTLMSGTQQTQAIFGVARTLIDLKTRHPETKPIVVWDGRASWRFDICPTYKSNRHSDDPKKEAVREAYKAQAPYIRQILKSMGVTQMQCSTHEADDLAGLIVKVKNPEDKITLLTGDQDWLQLVRNNVLWCNTRNGDIVHTGNFFEYTGYKNGEAFLDGKCLRGDSSDAIPGVGRIGEKGAAEFLATYGSVENFLQAYDQGVIKPTKKALNHLASEEGREIYRRNYKVMQLLNVAPYDRKNLTVNGSNSKNREEFIELCGKFAFASFLRDPDSILNLF